MEEGLGKENASFQTGEEAGVDAPSEKCPTPHPTPCRPKMSSAQNPVARTWFDLLDGVVGEA